MIPTGLGIELFRKGENMELISEQWRRGASMVTYAKVLDLEVYDKYNNNILYKERELKNCKNLLRKQQLQRELQCLKREFQKQNGGISEHYSRR